MKFNLYHRYYIKYPFQASETISIPYPSTQQLFESLLPTVFTFTFQESESSLLNIQLAVATL